MQSTSIADAALDRDWEKVRQLVERGDDVNVVGGLYLETGLHWAALWGNVSICKLLLKSGANISATDEDGDQPLHNSARRNEAAVCELLVAHGANVAAVNKRGRTPLMLAVDNSSAVPCRRLITNDSVNVEDCDGNHALHIASRRSNIVTVQLLVDCGADTNAVNKHGQTPLHTAADGWRDCPELCEILLKHGAEINAVGEDGNQPLHVACTESCTKTVKVMVSHGADMDTANKHGQTPLHTAAGGWKDCPELCESLLKRGAEINAVDNDGNQPLHVACKQGHSKTGNLFVSYSADVSVVNRKGHSPLQLLSQCVKGSKIVVGEGESGLHIAARHGMTVTVQLLVDCGAGTNAVNKDGQTPLHTAAGGRKDCPELCEILLKHDTKINAVDEDGNQPLQFACQKAHTQTVKWMLSHGADTNAANKHGQMPLHTAAGGEKDCPELCEILLKHSAKTNAVDEDGNQPLHLAGKGAEANAVDSNGDTSLHVALQNGNVKTAEVLLANGADCKALNGCGETVLHSLCKLGVDRHELCEDLISRGVDPHLADREGNLPFHIALKNKLPKTSCLLFRPLGGSTLDGLRKKLNLQPKDITCLLCFAVYSCDADVCQKLLYLGANPNILSTIAQMLDIDLPDAQRVAPLHIAVTENNSELCHLLLNHDASVNVQMHTQHITFRLHLAQPLHVAVQLGFIDVCRLLIERGALIDAETGKGKSPLHLAFVGNKNDIICLLLSHGAIVDNVKFRGVHALNTSGSESIASLVHDSASFPDEIVSQGEVALQIYLSSCNEGTAVTVFLRVDVVGRDGAGKTSLTKSLTLQKFDPKEMSTRGVVFDPKCQIIVKEACDWTTPLTIEHCRDMYDKNVIAIVADKLDTPEMKDQYFRSKVEKRSRRKKRGQKSTSAEEIDSSIADQTDGFVDVRNGTEQNHTLFAKVEEKFQQNSDEWDSAVKTCDTKSIKNDLEVTMPDFHRDRSSLLVSIAAAKPQCSQDAHHLAVSESIASVDVVEEETVGKVACNCSTKGSEEESTASLPQGSKHTVKTEATNSDADPAAPMQQDDQQPSQSTKDKRERQIEAALRPSGMSGTTLSRSTDTSTDTTVTLPEHVKKDVSKLLRDKKSLKKAQKEMMVTVLDYAGQHVFYATHHLCLSKAGFYYVVFDASQPLDGKTPSVFRIRAETGEIVHIPLSDDETNFDRLLEWMSAIHIMEPDHSHRIKLFDDIGIASPAMFLVGTHADKLRYKRSLLKKQDMLMRKKLEGTVLAEHIIWASKDRMCFYVDNTLTNPHNGRVDPQVRLLRQKTEEVARKVAQRHKLPLTWLKFEQEVRDVKVLDETKKTVSVEELLHIAKKAAGIKTKEELEVLLHYLSNRAVLLYHPKALKSGKKEVVLDVEWLISQLEKVVTIHTDVPPKLKNDITRTVQRGIMTASLIRYLLSESGSARQLVISLMNHFDLLCQYAGFEAHELHKADDNKDFLYLHDSEEDTSLNDIPLTENSDYFIPCLLERASPLESKQMDATLKTMPLVLSSAPLRIPRPLFYRVLTHLCKRFRQLPVLYSNVGYFHIFPDHRLEFSINRYSFQFVVLSESQRPPKLTVCACARDYIVNTVEKLKQEGMAGLHLRIGFHLTGTCLSVSGVPDNDEFVSLDGFPDRRKQLYSNKNRKVDVPPKLLMWYPQLEQNDELDVICLGQPIGSGSTTNRFSYSTPVRGLLGDTPALCIVEVSTVLDQPDDMEDDWRCLWQELLNRPLDEEVVSQKEEGPTQYLLKRWCQATPPCEATVGRLIEKLNSIHRNDVAGIMEKHCKKSPIDADDTTQRHGGDGTSTKDSCNSHLMDSSPLHSKDSDSRQNQKSPIHPQSDDSAGIRNGNLGVDGSQAVSREASLAKVIACPSVSYETPVQDLIGDTPSQCIIEMSKVLDQPDKMGDDWRRLWSELLNRPFNEEVVSQTEEGPTHFLLKLWCRTKPPSQTTVAHLIEALNLIYRNDVARIVEKYCKKSPIHPLTGTCDAHLSLHDSQGVSRKASLSEVEAYPSDAVATRDNCEVTEAQLKEVAKVARSKWEEVGLALGFKMEELEEYEEQEPKKLRRRLFRLLVDWKKKEENPTVEAIVLACTEADVGGEVKRALQVVKN